ncbi:MAG: peptide chain release factor N(5)-glutamine methyltransferase [Desulfobacterales bacterium]|jgi:release factor glutamine methyltransferase
MQNQSKSSDPEWTIIKLLEWTTSYFKSHDIDSPRSTAEILLAHVLKLKRIDLYLRYDQPLYINELSKFKVLIKRRVEREPVAYIVGVKEFWSMDFAVTKDVLIPRPETECLVEAALTLLPQDNASDRNLSPKSILELGTGSGAVILAIASMRPKPVYFASDRSVKAIRLARQNSKRHGLDTAVIFFCGDWFTPLNRQKKRFDMIISNPPYVPTRLIGRLQPEIYKYEPISALDGDSDGLFCLRHIINTAHGYLNRNGSLLLEIGHDQKNDVRSIIDKCGNYEHVAFTKDYSGYDRVVGMKKKKE